MKNQYLLILLLLLFGACQTSKDKSDNTQDSIAGSDQSKVENTPTQLTPAQELLAKSIKFHDPEGNWARFNATLTLAGERPDKPTRMTEVTIDNANSSFLMVSQKDSLTIEQGVTKDSCFAKINGSEKIDSAQVTKYRLDDKRIRFMRNYHCYLYGLPMKLKDKGTIIDEKVTKVEFQGKEYATLKVTYEAEVGKDTWYFYFDPQTYALSGYRFYHVEAENDGEYITLEGLETVQGIKIPKKRTWYINKDDRLLGADILQKGKTN